MLLYTVFIKAQVVFSTRDSVKRLTRREMLKTTAGVGWMGMTPLIMSGCSGSSAANSERADVVLWVPFPPRAVKQGGQIVFGYELYIGRALSLGLTVSGVQILRDGPTGAVIKNYEGAELAQCLFNKVIPFSADDAIFKGGDYAVLLAWPSVDVSDPIPAALYHRVYFSNGAVTLGGTTSISTEATVISPPVKGWGWFANFGPSNLDTHHRKSITVMQMEDGPFKISISQRFATDWMKVDSSNLRLYSNEGETNDNFYCYGAEVLAVASGTVKNVLDGLPEGPPGTNRPVPMTSQNAFGNSVVIEFDDGRYGAYCHLKPGSVSVAANQRVTPGQVIGRLGNSGNSDCPHLHFHVCNAPEPLFSEGLPFSFASYQLLGTYTNLFFPWTPSPFPQTRTMEMPEINQVLVL